MNTAGARFPFVLFLIPSLFFVISSEAHPQGVSQMAELTTARGLPGETFGYSVAISGNTLVVGVPGVHEGLVHPKSAALVFTNSGGAWTQVAKLVGTHAELGICVATSADGRTVVVGNDARAFIFVEPSTGWTDMTQTAELVPGRVSSGFGASVATSSDGRVVAVGSGGCCGGAFVYVEPSAGWAGTEQPTAILGTPNGAERFGSSIAINGNTVVVGDPEYADFVGATFVYILRSVPHTIPISAVLIASDSSVQLGFSVAMSNNAIAVGAYGTNSFAGAVYVFVKPAGGWTNMTQTAELSLPPSGQTALGYSVAIVGNTILAGAPTDTIGHNASQGAVFTYLRPPSGWVNSSTPNLSVTGSDSTAEDQFGWSVALSGKTAIVGAPFHAVGGNAMQGAAYVFGEQ
jgi:hypothetical protein